MKPTEEQILQWAREAGWTGIYSQWISPTEREHLTVPVTKEQIKTAFTLAYEAGRKDENEECEMACLETYCGDKAAGDWPTPEMCAAAIRARREQ